MEKLAFLFLEMKKVVSQHLMHQHHHMVLLQLSHHMPHKLQHQEQDTVIQHHIKLNQHHQQVLIQHMLAVQLLHTEDMVLSLQQAQVRFPHLV